MKIKIVMNLISCSTHNLDQTLFSFLLSLSNHYFSLLLLFCYSLLSQSSPGPVLWPSLTQTTPEKKDKPIWPHSRWKTEKKNNGEEMGSKPGPQHKKHLPYHCSAPTFVLNLVLIFFYSARCKFGGKRGHGETGLRT